MATNSLIKRIEKLEQKTGQDMPAVKLVLVDPDNYLEKDMEIKQLEKEGFAVISVCFVPAKTGKPDPDYAEYFKHLEQRKVS